MSEKVQASVTRLVRDDSGQDLIEYALLAGFISLIAILAVTATGGQLKLVWEWIQSKVETIKTS